MFHISHDAAVPETTRAAARKCFAPEFISVGTGFCTNRQKANNVVQKRCSTEINSVVDEDAGLVQPVWQNVILCHALNRRFTKRGGLNGY